MRSKAQHVRDLCDYIAGPSAGGDGEKVEHRGALNLLNLDHDGQVHEMADLAETAKRSAQPVQHWILSWRQGEQPTLGHADEAVRIFLAEMGLAEHQAIYALHRDTDNCHLHVAVNRVHPELERIVTVNRGFDIEVAHRAIARIEHAQGWQREEAGRYRVLEQGEVQRAGNGQPALRAPTTRARDFENQTGQKSAQQVVIDEGAELMRRSRNWKELHASLGARGIRFERKGSGAVLWVGETAVKASVAGRDCSMSALTNRLGEFEAPASIAELQRRTPEPTAPAAPGWHTYAAERQRHYAARKHERDSLRSQDREAWRNLVARHQHQRRELLSGNWRGRGAMLNALRSVLAARQAQEKAAMRERQQLERAALRERFPPWPMLEEWLRARGAPELADRWRFRERAPAIVVGDRDDAARPRDIRAFVAEARGWEVLYRRAGSPVGSPCFADRGRQILINDMGRDSVLAALQLSAQKWGAFEVFGSEAYKRQCVELAAEHGFRIVNPELQAEIVKERERRSPEPQRAAMSRPTVREPSHGPVHDVLEAYERHLDDLRRDRRHVRTHASRLDAMIAVRLRATGHSRDEVERAIREGATRLRPGEHRNPGEYARRAVAHAFGISGERDLRLALASREVLLALEGRSIGREPSLDVPPRRRGPLLGL